MADSILRFTSVSGVTLDSCELYTLDSDTPIATGIAATEETNRKRVYSLIHSNSDTGRLLILKKSGSTVVGSSMISVDADDTATYDSDDLAGNDARDAILDRVLSGFHDTVDSPGFLLQRIESVYAGTILFAGNCTGTPTTTTVDLGGVVTDNRYNDCLLVFLNGPAAGQPRPILSLVDNVATIDEAWTSAPDSGNSYLIRADHIHPIGQIQAGLGTEAKQDTILAGLPSAVEAGAGATTLALSVANVDVWVNNINDSNATPLQRSTTDDNGDVTFMLVDRNTYYLFTRAPGYNDLNGFSFVASND